MVAWDVAPAKPQWGRHLVQRQGNFSSASALKHHRFLLRNSHACKAGTLWTNSVTTCSSSRATACVCLCHWHWSPHILAGLLRLTGDLFIIVIFVLTRTCTVSSNESYPRTNGGSGPVKTEEGGYRSMSLILYWYLSTVHVMVVKTCTSTWVAMTIWDIIMVHTVSKVPPASKFPHTINDRERTIVTITANYCSRDFRMRLLRIISVVLVSE